MKITIAKKDRPKVYVLVGVGIIGVIYMAIAVVRMATGKLNSIKAEIAAEQQKLNDEEAEREIKLWFKPNEIPPSMRAYSAVTSDKPYYFKEGKLLTKYEPGSVCILALGDIVWESDLEALHLIEEGKAIHWTLETVAAKYLLNESIDGE